MGLRKRRLQSRSVSLRLETGLSQAWRFRSAGQFSEGGNDDEESEGDSDDASKAVEESLGARFAAQDFGGSGIEFGLKGCDLRLLVGDLLLLIGDLLVVARAQRVLPFLLLALVGRLAVLLELQVAGVSGKPDQTIRPG